MTERLFAKYRIETPYSLEEAAGVLAGEQSTGTFTKVPGETDSVRERFGAALESVVDLGYVEAPSLPGSAPPMPERMGHYQVGEVTVSFPIEGVGVSLPVVLSTVAGNLFELRQLSGIRLIDLDCPAEFASVYPGPGFGIDGTRRLTNVYDRPILGTIIKPSIGLAPFETAELVDTLASAGIDFIKDDELMADPPYSRLVDRCKAVMAVINRHADKTGKKVMYAFNITGSITHMMRSHDAVLEAGGTCVMVSLNSVGLSAVEKLREHCSLPIHGHRNGWGMLTRCPSLGVDFRVYQKIWRMVGVDHLHVNGLANKFWESDDSVVSSISHCLEPLFGGYVAMPVVSSGQWGGQAPETYSRTGTVDLIYLAGGGILGHPDGPKSGVAAIRQAWEAAVDGVDLVEFAREHRELNRSLEYFSTAAGLSR